MRRALQHQQIVLKFLGYYDGKCDGIWGPDSVAAMRSFELSGKFNPGYPRNGQPIINYRSLPNGLYVKDRRNNFIGHLDMPDGYIEKHLSEFVVYTEKFNPVETSGNTEVFDPLMESAKTEAVKTAASVEAPAAVAETETKIEPVKTDTSKVVAPEPTTNNHGNRDRDRNRTHFHQKQGKQEK